MELSVINGTPKFRDQVRQQRMGRTIVVPLGGPTPVQVQDMEGSRTPTIGVTGIRDEKVTFITRQQGYLGLCWNPLF